MSAMRIGILLCILLLAGSSHASRFGADAVLGPIVISERDPQWGSMANRLSEHWGTVWGQDRLRFHQRLGLFYQQSGAPPWGTAIVNLNGDVAVRASRRSWLTVGVTPNVTYQGLKPSSVTNFGALSYLSFVVNTYNPDFLVPSDTDYRGLGLAVNGLAYVQTSGDATARLTLRAPYTWRTPSYSLEAGPGLELSRREYGGTPRSRLELSLRALCALGTRIEEARLHPHEYLDRPYGGQVELSVSTTQWVSLTRIVLLTELRAEGWVRVWQNMLLEPDLELSCYTSEEVNSVTLVPHVALAYVARVPHDGYLIPSLRLDFDNQLYIGRWPGMVTISASLAWHG
jgi:hypothetical protein